MKTKETKNPIWVGQILATTEPNWPWPCGGQVWPNFPTNPMLHLALFDEYALNSFLLCTSYLSELQFFSCSEHFFVKVSESNPTFWVVFVLPNPKLNPTTKPLNPQTPQPHPDPKPPKHKNLKTLSKHPKHQETPHPKTPPKNTTWTAPEHHMADFGQSILGHSVFVLLLVLLFILFHRKYG